MPCPVRPSASPAAYPESSAREVASVCSAAPSTDAACQAGFNATFARRPERPAIGTCVPCTRTRSAPMHTSARRTFRSRARASFRAIYLETAMPIKPENRTRYPANWKAIVAAVRERSGNCCEGSPKWPDCRAENGQPHPETGSKVVLTTAHLDHVPENCDLSNLRCWCQRCHLGYDAEHHARTARETRRARKAIGDLFAAS
ncbi:hypothetical protein AWB78_01299 [Caballeronia calidae]|uniref:Uncharacterized protein n=2 Tax=Caballeronia calidae TaxID=1777139 RepID=A0A158A5V3_9BURK|nr:hypothetical protein AWB78_01299 [Caballeronia calidae]